MTSPIYPPTATPNEEEPGEDKVGTLYILTGFVYMLVAVVAGPTLAYGFLPPPPEAPGSNPGLGPYNSCPLGTICPTLISYSEK